MSRPTNRIEKSMPAGGKKISPEGIEKVLLADLDKIKFDVELDTFSNIMEKFREDKRSGNIPKLFGIDDWLKSKTPTELIEIGRGNWRHGGRIGYAGGSRKDYLDYVRAMNALGQKPMSLDMYNSLSSIMSDQEMVNMGSPGKAKGGRAGYDEGGDADKTFKPLPKDFVERIQKLTLIRSQLDPYSLKIIDELVEKSLAAGKK